MEAQRLLELQAAYTEARDNPLDHMDRTAEDIAAEYGATLRAFLAHS